MPSHSPKQAKTMSAIAHGWKPSGKAADIPVKVAKEFHAADKGKKYGKGHDMRKGNGYDRSAHEPGNPGFGKDREGKPPYRKYDAGTHAKQPHGKSIGIHDPGVNKKGSTSFEAESREHGGGTAGRTGNTRKGGGEVAFTGPSDRGSSLVEECGTGHAGQPSGKSIGAGSTGNSKVGFAQHHSGTSMGGSAHTFPGTHKAGYLRVSGDSKAHRIGSKK